MRIAWILLGLVALTAAMPTRRPECNQGDYRETSHPEIYRQCVYGHWMLMSCGPGTWYNPHYQICTHPKVVYASYQAAMEAAREEDGDTGLVLSEEEISALEEVVHSPEGKLPPAPLPEIPALSPAGEASQSQPAPEDNDVDRGRSADAAPDMLDQGPPQSDEAAADREDVGGQPDEKEETESGKGEMGKHRDGLEDKEENQITTDEQLTPEDRYEENDQDEDATSAVEVDEDRDDKTFEDEDDSIHWDVDEDFDDSDGDEQDVVPDKLRMTAHGSSVVASDMPPMVMPQQQVPEMDPLESEMLPSLNMPPMAPMPPMPPTLDMRPMPSRPPMAPQPIIPAMSNMPPMSAASMVPVANMPPMPPSDMAHMPPMNPMGMPPMSRGMEMPPAEDQIAREMSITINSDGAIAPRQASEEEEAFAQDAPALALQQPPEGVGGTPESQGMMTTDEVMAMMGMKPRRTDQNAVEEPAGGQQQQKQQQEKQQQEKQQKQKQQQQQQQQRTLDINALSNAGITFNHDQNSKTIEAILGNERSFTITFTLQ